MSCANNDAINNCMKISIKNCSIPKRKEIKKLLPIIFYHLFEEKDYFLFPHLEINIIFSELDVDGYTHTEDDEYPSTFILELNKNLEGDELLLTLAHEFVHVKQLVMGELSVCGMYWKNKKIKNKLYHEDEAYRLESILYEKIKNNY
jgi:hypothetical protein